MRVLTVLNWCLATKCRD